MISRTCAVLLTIVVSIASAWGADDEMYSLLLADRLEYVESPDAWVWDLQGWIGGDYRKLWIKAEGESADSVDHNELQVLFSRAWTPFFDWQIGIRHDVEPAPSRTYLALGIQGLAPQWFEIDSALFLSEGGDISARVEAEYDLLLTQRLVLQPRLEFSLSAGAVPEIGLGSGLTNTELGMRLRYEFHRKFAPYLGISWTQYYGDTADFAENRDDLSAVIGLRLWY